MKFSVFSLAVLTALALTAVPASADHGYGPHFMGKNTAKRKISNLIRQEPGVGQFVVEECRYGWSSPWNRKRWLCDVYLESNGQTYCGWGRVVKKRGSRYTTSFSASKYGCY